MDVKDTTWPDVLGYLGVLPRDKPTKFKVTFHQRSQSFSILAENIKIENDDFADKVFGDKSEKYACYGI